MSFFYKVLGKKTLDEKERVRVEFLKQLLALREILIKRPEDYAKKIASDFFVDSVVVARKDGSIIMANKDENDTPAVLEFLNAACTTFQKADFFLIKEDGYCNAIYCDGDLVYAFKSPGEISAIEAKAAARDLKKSIEKYRLNRKGNKIIQRMAM